MKLKTFSHFKKAAKVSKFSPKNYILTSIFLVQTIFTNIIRGPLGAYRVQHTDDFILK